MFRYLNNSIIKSSYNINKYYIYKYQNNKLYSNSIYLLNHSNNKQNTSDSIENKDVNLVNNKTNINTDISNSNANNTTKHANVTTIGSTIHYAEQKYEDFEANLMKTINESNQRRFRFLLLGTIVSIIWISSVFGTRIRKAFTEQTAGLAKETLENESLKIQTQELAMAVVQTILNDKEITSHAALFLKEASTAPETQQAILKLTLDILQHPDTLNELTTLGIKLLNNIIKDRKTIQQLQELSNKIINDHKLKANLIILITELIQDPIVYQAIVDMVLKIIERDDINVATQDLLSNATSEVMKESDIMDQSRQFVADVMGDDILQKEGGNAIWKSVTYALKPGFIRLTGVSIVMLSIAAIKIIISPY